MKKSSGEKQLSLQSFFPARKLAQQLFVRHVLLIRSNGLFRLMFQLDHGKQSLSFDSHWDVLFSHTNTPKSDLVPPWSLKQRRGNILANCREGKLLPRCSPHRAESCSVRPKSRCRGKMIAFCWKMSAFLALSGRKFYRQGCNVAGNALK